MSEKQENQETDRKDSSTKHPRGSKKVHSEKDDSTEDGYKPNNPKK